MIETYKGRKIAAVTRRIDGLTGVTVRVNGQHVGHYGPGSGAIVSTIEGAVEQTMDED